MRKQEYIHLHGLLVEVAQQMVERDDLPADALDEYDALDAHPLTINESKETHHEAVMVLASCIREGLEQDPEYASNLPTT